jgi:hypothetical protein
MECACDQTENLRGAAVNAYLTRFLERVSDADAPAGTYQCRICGAHWLRQAKDANQPAELVRVSKNAFFQKNEKE